MNKKYTSAGIAVRIWLLTCVVLNTGIAVVLGIQERAFFFVSMAGISVLSLIGSIPGFVLLVIFIPFINRVNINWKIKFFWLLIVQFVTTIFYGAIAVVWDISFGVSDLNASHVFQTGASAAGILFFCCAVASFISLKSIVCYFSGNRQLAFSFTDIFFSLFQSTSINKITMETFEQEPFPQQQPQSQSNRLLLKGAITGTLILLMLVPTFFITNIIKEREQRQQEVVQEVSSKWANAQTISAPYLVVPYIDTTLTSDGKTISTTKQMILLANDLSVTGKIFPEQRPRSIYKVLLYKSDVQLAGSFKPKWPLALNTTSLDFSKARLCFGISDFKGIEEEIQINFNNSQLVLSPGLPLNDLDDIGLSVPVSFTSETINAGIPFSMRIKLKGSEQLHFVPLSANSKFAISSSWPNPSFDGNVLPNERQVSEKGFTAKWNFSQANLPFGTVLKQGTISKANLAFGVSMVQPADQYDKTMRSVKYAILFIGLTFALFFIIEIMQGKPFHPVQYVLVGLALVIFYTLLLSISEYLLFDHAYLIAAAATVTLISLYAKSHFANWKTAALFFCTLSVLYGFIFILIRLEDTALLVGSVGLFIVLALVMYASRRVQWYGGHAVVNKSNAQ